MKKSRSFTQRLLCFSLFNLGALLMNTLSSSAQSSSWDRAAWSWNNVLLNAASGEDRSYNPSNNGIYFYVGKTDGQYAFAPTSSSVGNYDMKVEQNGKVTIANVSGIPLTINNYDAGNTWATMIRMIKNNSNSQFQSNNSTQLLEIGAEASDRNAGHLSYTLVGKSSDNNYISLGLFGRDKLLNVTAAGNVGIGTTAPNALLHLKQKGQITDNAAGSSYGMSFENSGSGHKYYMGYQSGGYFGMGFYDPTNASYKASWKIDGISGKMDIGNNVANSTNLLLDVHGHAIFNNDSDSLTYVSINTDARVGNAALTVGGPTYIGGWRGIEAGAVKGDYLKKYNLWVQKGIVSEDFIFSPKTTWKDEVFKP